METCFDCGGLTEKQKEGDYHCADCGIYSPKNTAPYGSKKYRVAYTFEGRGWVDINAESKEEAEEKYYNGEFENEYEGNSHDYCVVSVVENGEVDGVNTATVPNASKEDNKQTKNGFDCPLCGEFISHEEREGVHTWACPACPFLGVENY